MNKTFFKIAAGAALVFGLAACNQKIEYTTSSFVAFDASSLTVREDAGSVVIPVYAYTKDGDLAFPRSEGANTTVTFEVVENTAHAGENFSIEPANGVLTFDGTSEGAIKVNIVDIEGSNGEAQFTIRILSASDGYTLGGLREITVTIQDTDNPLADILGTYTSNTLQDAQGASATIEITISAVEGSLDQVTIDGIADMFAPLGPEPLVGVVSGGMINVAAEQVITNYDGEDIMFYGISEYSSQGVALDNWYLRIEDDGTLTTEYGWFLGYLDGNSISYYDMYFPQEVIFTKK